MNDNTKLEPELPQATFYITGEMGKPMIPAYTAEQVRAYALSAIAADRNKREGWTVTVTPQVINRAWLTFTEKRSTKEAFAKAIKTAIASAAPVSAVLSDDRFQDAFINAAIDANLPPAFMLTYAKRLDDFARALASRLRLPEGWVAVPREPTPEMIEAGANADPERESVWAAYIAAAPTEGQAKPMQEG